MQTLVPLGHGHFEHNLSRKRHGPARDFGRQSRQRAVIKSRPPAQSPTLTIKRQPWHENRADWLIPHRPTTFGRLYNAGSRHFQVVLKIRDFIKRQRPLLPVHPWQAKRNVLLRKALQPLTKIRFFCQYGPVGQ